MKTITRQKSRRMEATLRAEIEHHQKCLPLLASLDAEVFAAGMELFSHEKGLALWLCAPARVLGGRIPLFVARTEAGRKKVANVLGALAHGGYL